MIGWRCRKATVAWTYVLNDICDVRVDAVNSPRRALVRGEVPVGLARGLGVVMFAVSISLAGFVSFWFFMLVCAVTTLLIVYDLYSKRMGAFKDVLVAAMTVSLYPLKPAVESVRSAFTIPFGILQGGVPGLFDCGVFLAVLSAFGPPQASIRFIYAEVVVVTAGSMADLLLFGP